MPGVTEQEIAQAKQMNLYQYMQLCEPDNFKPEGPGQFRHKGHSSLTFAEDGSWTYFKTNATGRTALNYLIAVEGVSFVEAVREINRIQGGVRPSFQPVKAPSPPAEKKPAKEFRLPKPDKNNYAATAYLRKRCIHPNVLTVCSKRKSCIRRASRIIRIVYLSGAMEMERPRAAACAVVRKSSSAAIFPAAKRYIRSTSKLLPLPTRWKCTKHP